MICRNFRTILSASFFKVSWNDELVNILFPSNGELQCTRILLYKVFEKEHSFTCKHFFLGKRKTLCDTVIHIENIMNLQNISISVWLCVNVSISMCVVPTPPMRKFDSENQQTEYRISSRKLWFSKISLCVFLSTNFRYIPRNSILYTQIWNYFATFKNKYAAKKLGFFCCRWNTKKAKSDHFFCWKARKIK